MEKSVVGWTDEKVVEFVITNKQHWMGFWSEFRHIVDGYHPYKEEVIYDVMDTDQFLYFMEEEYGIEVELDKLNERDALEVFQQAIYWIDGMAEALAEEDFESNLIPYWPPQLLELYNLKPTKCEQWADITKLLEIEIGQK